MSTEGIAQKVHFIQTARLDKLSHVLGKTVNCRFQDAQVKKREQRYPLFVRRLEVLNQVLEVGERAEKTVEEYQSFTLTFFYVLEFSLALDFVIHRRIVMRLKYAFCKV